MLTKKSLILTLISAFFCLTLISCSNSSNANQENSPSSDLLQDPSGNQETVQHSHSFGDWVTVSSATCAEIGSMERACDCGEKETQTIPMTEHIIGEAIIDVQPTCTEIGSKHFECTLCAKVISAESIREKGHNLVSVYGYPATCTSNGLSDGIMCSECDFVSVKQEVITNTGHQLVADPKSDPTCTSTGLTEGQHCSVCNEIIVAQQIIPVLEHTYIIDVAQDPSCTSTGLTEGQHCSVCNETLIAQQIIPVLDHTYTIDVAQDPSCTSTGLTEGSHCIVCNHIGEAQQTIQALGHDYDIYTNTCNRCYTKEHSEITNKEDYESLGADSGIVFYLDQYITEDDTTTYSYPIKATTSYIRFVGNTERSFNLYIIVENRSEPLTIAFVDTDMFAKNPLILSESSAEINVEFYGSECRFACLQADAGQSGALFQTAENGATGSNAFDISGILNISTYANSCTIIGGQGGNGGNGSERWGSNGDNGADGGNGGYGIYASEINVSIKSELAQAPEIYGGNGGNGGNGGKALPMIPLPGLSSILYDDGNPGDPGLDQEATNVPVTYN